ncbi:hypothetical protein [Sporomusa sp.]|uniref:hypothetical protein n=1 Tax=Sporomusa sp. TaxID=2078658 RepID=UPI002BAAF1DA|nr:hypothetical protein [Sporomusa sp.]HWR45544.1 hypothetical protein [Sporomusa sp.]
MNKLTDASVFSKTHHIGFEKAVTKPGVEKLVMRLIQDIGRPLSHNGIIVGHIKVLAKLSNEEFIFLSLTRLDRVDVKFSAQWTTDLASEFNSINLDINVLVFGYSRAVIAELVDASLAVLRREGICEDGC